MKTNWRVAAECRGTDPDVFFPHGDSFDATREAKAICSLCPVRPECYEEFKDEKYGIFGGTSEYDRARINRGRKRSSLAAVWAESDVLVHGGTEHRKQQVLALYDSGMSVAEIATSLDAPHSTVWSIVNRARQGVA